MRNNQKVTLIDVGYCVARIRFPSEEEAGNDDFTPELEIIQPASEGVSAQSVTIYGVEALQNLRNAVTGQLFAYVSRKKETHDD